MLRHLIGVVSTSVVLAHIFLPAPASAQEPFTGAEIEAVKRFLRENFRRGNAGMVIGLLDAKGEQVFSAGIMDNDTEARLGAETVFEIGSISKWFTVLLLLDMVRRGEVMLKDPVECYLPKRVKVPQRGNKKITLGNLAAQDSGLPINAENFSSKDLQKAYAEYTVEDMYAFLEGYKLTVDPGLKFEYSNIGITLLGHALERKTGQSYEALVMNRICKPLDMTSTRIALTPELQARLAIGHDTSGKRAAPLRLQVMAPSGALRSTTKDMMKCLSAILGFTESELSPAIKNSQIIRHRGPWDIGNSAMPWFDRGVYCPPGSELLGHEGGTFGFSTFIGFDKTKRRGVVILSNQTVIHSGGIGYAILQGMPLTRHSGTQLVRELVGIGTALSFEKIKGLVRITKIFRKSPADQAGLAVGDYILKINGTSVAGKQPGECFAIMNGPVGTRVQLELIDAEGRTRKVDLTKQRFLTAS